MKQGNRLSVRHLLAVLLALVAFDVSNGRHFAHAEYTAAVGADDSGCERVLGGFAETIYVLDTNVAILDPNAVQRFGKADVVIPDTVLAELDKFKTEGQSARAAASRSFSHALEKLRSQGKDKAGNLLNGVDLQSGGKLRIVMAPNETNENLRGLDLSVNDHRIVATARQLQSQNPNSRVVLVTHDTNVRILADVMGVEPLDFDSNVVGTIAESEESDGNGAFRGYSEVIDDSLYAAFRAGESVKAPRKYSHNEFAIVRAREMGSNQPIVARFDAETGLLTPLGEDTLTAALGIKPRNDEQRMAMTLIRDPNVDFATITGGAGSGKTLTGLAAGLELVLAPSTRYKKLIVYRVKVTVSDRDLGALPGTAEEKISPYLQGIWDNLEEIAEAAAAAGVKGMPKPSALVNSKRVEIGILDLVRGRTIKDAVILVEEAQNMSADEMKVLMTRAGQNTKVIVSGDLTQIDARGLTEYNSGFAEAMLFAREYDRGGHVTLQMGERSHLASEAVKFFDRRRNGH